MADEDVKALFGRRVRQLREGKGATQEAFAHAVRIDRSYYGSIERGERNVSLENICRIAGGLGVPPAELFRFDAVPAADRPTADGTEIGRPPRPPGRTRRRSRG